MSTAILDAQRLDEAYARYAGQPATAPEGLRALIQLAAEVGNAFENARVLTEADKLRIGRRIDELVVATASDRDWIRWMGRHRREAAFGGAAGVAVTLAAAVGFAVVHERRSHHHGALHRVVEAALTA